MMKEGEGEGALPTMGEGEGEGSQLSADPRRTWQGALVRNARAGMNSNGSFSPECTYWNGIQIQVIECFLILISRSPVHACICEGFVRALYGRLE